MAAALGPEYDALTQAVQNYYGQGFDPLTQYGEITYADWEQIYAQSSDFMGIVNNEGETIGYAYNAWQSVGDGGVSAAALAGNSNLQTGTAAAANSTALSIPTNATFDDVAQKYSMSSGAKKSVGGAPVPSVIATISTAMAGAQLGIALGKTINKVIYDTKPGFFDSATIEEYNPDNWGKWVYNWPTDGIGGVARSITEAILQIEPDQSGGYASQMYIPEETAAMLAWYMYQQGFFDQGQPVVEPSATAPYQLTPGSFPVAELSVGFRFQHQYAYLQIASANGTVYGVTAPINSNYPDETQIFFFSSSSFRIYYSDSGSTYTADTRTYNGRTLYYYWRGVSYAGTPSTPVPAFPSGYYMQGTSPATIPASVKSNSFGGDGWQAAFWYALFGATIDTQSPIDGVGTQSGATTPDFSGATDYQSVHAILQNQYPDLWDNAVERSRPNPDYDPSDPQSSPVIKTVYIPVGQIDGSEYGDPDYVPYISPDGQPIVEPSPWPNGLPVPVINLTVQPTATDDPGTTSQADPTVTPQSADSVLDITAPSIGQTPGTGDPNPPDTGSGSSPAVTLPDGSASALFSVYHPTQAQLNSFGSWLWSSNFVDQLLKMFNDPMQAIIGLHKVFVTPSIGGSSTIHVGYLDSGVASETVDSQYTTVDCGEINCAEYFGNVFDYGPFTDIDLYLPFVGIVPLSVDDVMRSRIRVIYHVDVLTGAALVDVKVLRDGDAGGILYQYSGNCAVQYPLSSGSYMGIVSTIASLAGSVAATALTGGAAAPLLIGAAAGLMGGSASTRVSKSGSFAGNPGAMGGKIPYLIISRPQTALADGQEQYIGQPAHKTVVIGSLSGYTKLLEVHLEGIPATGEELQEIESLLKEGVIL